MEVLALGFLILIGFTLLLEGLHKEIPKGYIYFAVAFSLLIEFTNIRVRKKRKKNTVKLNKPYDEKELKEAVEELNK
jgi:predicted tellurium resistance membrane protein TerC